jgi:hypothetical protein
MSKRIIKSEETRLRNIIKDVIIENHRNGYGHKEINNLYNDLNHDEDVWLSDNSGDLRGDVVKKIEYIRNMLNSAIYKEDWSMVRRAMSYIDVKFK